MLPYNTFIPYLPTLNFNKAAFWPWGSNGWERIRSDWRGEKRAFCGDYHILNYGERQSDLHTLHCVAALPITMVECERNEGVESKEEEYFNVFSAASWIGKYKLCVRARVAAKQNYKVIRPCDSCFILMFSRSMWM